MENFAADGYGVSCNYGVPEAEHSAPPEILPASQRKVLEDDELARCC